MKTLAVSIATPNDERSEPGLTETFAVRGELDIASSSVLERALIDELAAIPDEIVLGLGELTFIDIAGLRALERVRAHLAAHGCRLTVRSVRPQAARLLELAAEATTAKPADAVAHSAARRRPQGWPIRLVPSQRLGLATIRLRSPRTSPRATTPDTAGCRRTARGITGGSVTVASTRWTVT